MSTRVITVELTLEAVQRIALMFGSDISTKEGSEDFFNLALVTLLSMGEEVKKGNVIVSMKPSAVGGFSGKIFKFPDASPLRRVK